MNWLNLGDRHCQSILSSVYKCFDYKIPEYFVVCVPARPCCTNTGIFSEISVALEKITCCLENVVHGIPFPLQLTFTSS